MHIKGNLCNKPATKSEMINKMHVFNLRIQGFAMRFNVLKDNSTLALINLVIIKNSRIFPLIFSYRRCQKVFFSKPKSYISLNKMADIFSYNLNKISWKREKKA